MSIASFLFQLKIRNFQTTWAKTISGLWKRFTYFVLCHFIKKKGRIKELITIINGCFSCLMQWKHCKEKVLRLFPTLFQLHHSPNLIILFLDSITNFHTRNMMFTKDRYICSLSVWKSYGICCKCYLHSFSWDRFLTLQLTAAAGMNVI